eukprot:12507566-Prorocentrum_lima.AAC.1
MVYPPSPCLDRVLRKPLHHAHNSVMFAVLWCGSSQLEFTAEFFVAVVVVRLLAVPPDGAQVEATEIAMVVALLSSRLRSSTAVLRPVGLASSSPVSQNAGPQQVTGGGAAVAELRSCLLYTSPSPRDSTSS